jgi:hypothetical protein
MPSAMQAPMLVMPHEPPGELGGGTGGGVVLGDAVVGAVDGGTDVVPVGRHGAGNGCPGVAVGHGFGGAMGDVVLVVDGQGNGPRQGRVV